MRASQFMAYLNADEAKVHNRSRTLPTGRKEKWQTVSVNGKELSGFTLTDRLKEVRKQYRKNVIHK